MLVFVDYDKWTHHIDSEKTEAAIGPKTNAINLAHSWENPFTLDVVTLQRVTGTGGVTVTVSQVKTKHAVRGFAKS